MYGNTAAGCVGCPDSQFRVLDYSHGCYSGCPNSLPPDAGGTRTTWAGGGGGAGVKEKSHCRSSLDACLQQLPPILEHAELKGIPGSKKEVDLACKAFKTGMGCMEQYYKDCLTPRDRRIFESHVVGAKHTFRFLCDDPVFQAEYLQYTGCYKGISKDWDACANKFIALVEEEMSRKNSTDESRLVELCCAKHGFLKCVYSASWLKCRKEEAIFIRKIADTLANIRVYTPRCKSVPIEVCTSGSTRPECRVHSLATLLILLFALVVFYLV